MIELLEDLLSEFGDVDYGEMRYHERQGTRIAIRQGELEAAGFTIYSGVGVRVLHRGGWGFSSTSRINQEDLRRAIHDAIRGAKASGKKGKVRLGQANLAKGKFTPTINDPLTDHSFEEKLALVRKTEGRLRSFKQIVSATCSYSEMLDHKYILTTDGARAEIIDSKPEFVLIGVAADGGEQVMAVEALGATGGWKDLFKKEPDELVEIVAKRTSDLLKARHPKGERATVILDPGIVGLLVHEAIGHPMEADQVLAGAISKDKIGQRVASELVTLVDSGPSQFGEHAGGVVLVDDEGVVAERTVIIKDGILRSYLHNRESAGIFGVPSTGNARAFEYSNDPLIRMRNTYIEPGDRDLEEMISEVKEGYLLKGAVGGEADVNAEFMFNVQEAYRIENGRIGELLRGVAISGQAFHVLQTVDAVGKEFRFGLGAGTCGKGPTAAKSQPARVDAGGPYLRCQAIIGGRR
ncbi:TldD/PmbA family protein [Dehalococcoidia bacterium]|nr:TldD/PmbA family protein [Dehalococcoidia bacterium]